MFAVRHPRSPVRLVAAGTFLVLLLLAAFAPVPYVSLSPGPTFNTVGEYAGMQLIVIEGRESYASDGRLDLTTVAELGPPRSRLFLFGAIKGWLDPDVTVLPERLLNPEGLSEGEVQQESVQQMASSQHDAITAALNYLELPVREVVTVTGVNNGSPADGQLQAGDEVVAVDGVPVTSAEQVGERVRAVPIGTTLTFEVLRDGKTKLVRVTSAPNPDDPTRPYVGITVSTVAEPDGFTVELTLEDVGGPSAGLMFTLGIIDSLTPEQETHGQHIAGTGTITPDGKVGPIGGIAQKLIGSREAGATVFLAPAANCDEVVGAIPDGLTVVPVTTLQEALDAMAATAAGERTRTCAQVLAAAS